MNIRRIEEVEIFVAVPADDVQPIIYNLFGESDSVTAADFRIIRMSLDSPPMEQVTKIVVKSSVWYEHLGKVREMMLRILRDDRSVSASVVVGDDRYRVDAKSPEDLETVLQRVEASIALVRKGQKDNQPGD